VARRSPHPDLTPAPLALQPLRSVIRRKLGTEDLYKFSQPQRCGSGGCFLRMSKIKQAAICHLLLYFGLSMWIIAGRWRIVLSKRLRSLPQRRRLPQTAGRMKKQSR